MTSWKHNLVSNYIQLNALAYPHHQCFLENQKRVQNFLKLHTSLEAIIGRFKKHFHDSTCLVYFLLALLFFIVAHLLMNVPFSYHCLDCNYFFSAALCFKLSACLENSRLECSCKFTPSNLQKLSLSPYSGHSLNSQHSLLHK